MGRADVAVIGTGPAGLSAAVTAAVRNKSVLLIGSPEGSSKVEKAHTVRNYLGLPEVSGEDMKKAFLDHAAGMGLTVTPAKITAVYAMGDYFMLQNGEQFLEADSVILAAGVAPQKLIPGEEALLGSGVSYCATCDASLYRGRPVAVVAYGKKEEAEADFLSEVCSSVTYLPVYPEAPEVSDQIAVAAGKPLSLERKEDGVHLTTSEGEITADCVFVLRESVSPEHLVPGLEMEEGHVKVDRKMRTNLPGLFACGDIAGPPYQYIKAAGEGNVAALSAVAYLDEKRRSRG